MAHRSSYVAALLVLLSAMIGIGAAVLSHSSETPDSNRVTTLTVPSAQISTDDIATMRRNGDTIDPIGLSALPTAPIPAQDALNAVPQAFNFLGQASVHSATLVELTDAKAGVVETGGAGVSSKIRPIISGRPVWLFVFENFSMPIYGPLTEEGSGVPLEANRSRMWVAVDAITGQVLIARSLSSDG